jgi:Holliday junction resolvase RusA-like endonuclease
MAIRFFISCLPRGQARVRHAVIGGHSRQYKAKEQLADERTLEALMMPFKPLNPLTGPLSLRVTAIMPIPKGKSKKWLQMANDDDVFPTTKPDASNILKHLEDVMQSMRFFEDDKQLVTVNLKKRYGDNPGYSIVLDEM